MWLTPTPTPTPGKAGGRAGSKTAQTDHWQAILVIRSHHSQRNHMWLTMTLNTFFYSYHSYQQQLNGTWISYFPRMAELLLEPRDAFLSWTSGLTKIWGTARVGSLAPMWLHWLLRTRFQIRGSHCLDEKAGGAGSTRICHDHWGCSRTSHWSSGHCRNWNQRATGQSGQAGLGFGRFFITILMA